MKTLIVATGNINKMKEMKEILSDTSIEIVSMKDAGIDIDIEETGTTFAENALIKAAAVSKVSGKMAIADDSGLVIDSLGGEPGIYSARYMGEDTSYQIKNSQILSRMKDIPEDRRTARFVCAMACAFPDGNHLICEETFEGHIAHCIAGENGFGYDPIFYLPEKGCTSAELTPEEKNALSHRGKALRRMKEMLKPYLTENEVK